MSKFLRSPLAPLIFCCVVLGGIFLLSRNLSGNAFSARIVKPDSLACHSKSQSSTDSLYIHKAELDSIMQSWEKRYKDLKGVDFDESKIDREI